MKSARRAPMYDLFKLVVALILLALLVFFRLNFDEQGHAKPSAITGLLAGPTAVGTALTDATQTPASGEAAAEPSATVTLAQPTATTAALTATAAATATAAPTQPQATATQAQPTATAVAVEAAATATPATEAAATATPQATTAAAPDANSAACAALPSFLKIGDTARVTTALHMRSVPQIASDNIVRTHVTGTLLEVIGGPQCVPFGDGAYLWWEVRNSQNETGWSAEGSVAGKTYFMQPVQ